MADIRHLHLDARGAEDPDIYLAARAGNVMALAGAPPRRHRRRSATRPPRRGVTRLLLREGPIAMSGNQALLATAIGALSAAFVA
jgi:hypothetical protein